MAQVTVTIAGRTYRMACGDGEEEHLAGLAAVFDAKIEEMRAAFGEIGDMRLHVMAALTFADDLSEAAQAGRGAGGGARRRCASSRSPGDERSIGSRGPGGRGHRQGGRADGAAGQEPERPALQPAPERLTGIDRGPPCRGGRSRLYRKAGLRGASGDHISPGPYRSQRELFLARSVDRVNTAPTYAVGSRDRFSDGFRGSARFLHDLSRHRRQGARCATRRSPRRDALDPGVARRRLARRSPSGSLALPELAGRAAGQRLLADPQRGRLAAPHARRCMRAARPCAFRSSPSPP